MGHEHGHSSSYPRLYDIFLPPLLSKALLKNPSNAIQANDRRTPQQQPSGRGSGIGRSRINSSLLRVDEAELQALGHSPPDCSVRLGLNPTLNPFENPRVDDGSSGKPQESTEDSPVRLIPRAPLTPRLPAPLTLLYPASNVVVSSQHQARSQCPRFDDSERLMGR